MNWVVFRGARRPGSRHLHRLTGRSSVLRSSEGLLWKERRGSRRRPRPRRPQCFFLAGGLAQQGFQGLRQQEQQQRQNGCRPYTRIACTRPGGFRNPSGGGCQGPPQRPQLEYTAQEGRLGGWNQGPEPCCCFGCFLGGSYSALGP